MPFPTGATIANYLTLKLKPPASSAVLVWQGSMPLEPCKNRCQKCVRSTVSAGRDTLKNQHPRPMVLDVDLGALRRLHPVHKGAPKGNPKALKNQHEFSQVDAWPMCLVPSWNLLGASCWLIFRSLSLPRLLLAPFFASLSLSKPIFTVFFFFRAPEPSQNLENQ